MRTRRSRWASHRCLASRSRCESVAVMDLRALIFVPALVAAALCVFVFFTFAAHYYLTVLESTAAGSREVTWPGESLTDLFWKPFYLAWLLCLWLGPAYVIGRVLAGSWHLVWLKLAVPVLVAWLLYPVSQLSSLCASSVWMPLHPQVFARLAQRPGVALGFFALTLPVFALGGLAFRWAFLTAEKWELLLAGVPLVVVTMFLHARLLGRLAFELMFAKDILKRTKKKPPKKAKKLEEYRPADRPEPVQPSDLPPIDTPDGELAGYNVLMSDDPPAPKTRVVAEVVEDGPPAPHVPAPHPQDRARTRADDDDDAAPYEMKPSEVKDDERVPEAVLKPSAEEMALLDRSGAPKRLKRAWGAGLFACFGQPATISAMTILCLIGLAAGAMVRVARQFDPTSGGG